MLAGYLHPCHPVALWHRAGSLGALAAVMFPAQLGTAPAPYSVALALAQLARAEQVPHGPAESHWLYSVAKMLQMQ